MVTIYLVSLLVPLGILWFGYPVGTEWLAAHWSSEEYSHAALIPVVGLYMTLHAQQPNAEKHPRFRYWGVVLLSLAILMLFLAYYGKMISLYGFSLLAMTWGLFCVLAGRDATRKNLSALLLLAFMVPLPTVLFNGVSSFLQLVSSQLGAWVIELFGITVHLEGNVIDIGSMQMQVVEACSGLRYLLPLIALAYIVAVLHRASVLRGVLLLVAAIPITIFMNSLRIALTAVFAEYIGVNVAEGFLHDFEGWVLFLPALGLLVLTSRVLSRFDAMKGIRSDFSLIPRVSFQDRFATERASLRGAGKAVLASAFVLVVAAALLPQTLSAKTISSPIREEFSGFPLELTEWKGHHRQMEAIYRNALPWTDYLLADYSKREGGTVNVFIPYFTSLYEDSYTHNPAVCLPGNGWTIEEEAITTLPDVRSGSPSVVHVNRLVATIGGKKHVVYYWFQHKGRVIASQHMVKPVLLWNSLVEGRTDGALVRLTVGLDTVPDMTAADAALEDLSIQVMQVLPSFVPD